MPDVNVPGPEIPDWQKIDHEINETRVYDLLLRTAVFDAALNASEAGAVSELTERLPKDAFKLLLAKFYNIAILPDNSSDPFLRRTYLAFYAVLLKEEEDNIQRSDRPQILIAQYLGCVAKELQNYPHPTPQVAVNDAGRHFVDLMRDILGKQAPLLDRQLASYRKAFSRPQLAIGSSLVADTARLFDVRESILRDDIERAQLIVSDVGVRRDLENLILDLQQDRHPVYTKKDFGTGWPRWKEKEIREITELLPPVVAAQKGSGIIPSFTRSFFALILRKCLARDAALESPLGVKSQKIIKLVQRWWRISDTAYASIALQINSLELFEELGIEMMEDWPLCDRILAIESLSSLRQQTLSQLGSALKLLFDPSMPKLGPLIKRWELVCSLLHKEEAPDIARLVKRSVLQASDAEYDSLISAIPRDQSLSATHIVDLASDIVRRIKRIQKRYPRPLFHHNIAKLACARLLRLFSVDFQPMFKHCCAIASGPLDFEDIKPLHAHLTLIDDLLKQSGISEGLNIDCEKLLWPHLWDWAVSSARVSQQFVEPALNQDSFTPLDPPECLFSSSVKDLFTGFHASFSLVDSLEWRDMYHVAKVLTKIVDGISAALCDWVGRLHMMLLQEIAQHVRPIQSSKTLSKSWLSVPTVNGHSPSPEPELFSAEACIRLNDVAAAFKQLVELEESVQSDLIARRIQAQERRQGMSQAYIFTLTIVRASDLPSTLGKFYVTLIDQDTRTQIGRTQSSNEEGTWNQSFDLEAQGSRPRLLKALLWNSTTSQHDVVGSSALKLDPKSFDGRDYGLTARWLDMDSGKGRLLVHVAMDVQRDDIRFYFGKALRQLSRTQSEMVNLIVEQFAGYIFELISFSTLKNFLQPSILQKEFWRRTSATLQAESPGDCLVPLYDYLNKNFSTLAVNLTLSLRLDLMLRTWERVLEAIEQVIVPPSEVRTLTSKELEIVFTWLAELRGFFHNDGAGPSLESLQSLPRYQQIMAIPVYYDVSTSVLKEECEKIMRQGLAVSTRSADLLARQRTVMAHRSRRVIENKKAELREVAAPRSDDVILSILRSRGEHQFYDKQIRLRERLTLQESAQRAVRGE